MSLKNRMFRSNILYLVYALLALLLMAALAVAMFEGQFDRKFESLESRRLDAGVMKAAAAMEKESGNNWEKLKEELQTLGYELAVVKDGQIVFGDNRSEGWELLQGLDLEAHQSGEVELFYLQRLTVVGKYGPEAGVYALAVKGREEEWWMGPIKQSGNVLFYALLTVAVMSTASFLLLSSVFTRRFLRKIMDPVEALEKGAERIREGNLKEPVEYQGDEEFEQLCQTFNDMQRSMLEEQARWARDEQARTDMITGISHDLRTPLTSVQGYIKGILDGVADTEEKQKRYLRTAYESTREMDVLLQKLFDFSRMESGQMPFHMIEGDLAELVDAWAAKREQEPERVKMLLTVRRESEVMPDIRMDIDQIRRILDNLLENSLKYAKACPVRILVRVYACGPEACLEWRDNGEGVPQEKLGHIFERFYRCDEARHEKGSGIGLYVVKWIMEQHGGRAEAENPGGLLIRLHFPIKRHRGGQKDGTNINCRG